MTAPDPGPGPFAALLGITREVMEGGHGSFTVRVAPEHLNPHGVVHGGVLYSLVDQAMGGALTSCLAPGERCATLEIKINYLAPIAAGTIRADATVVARTGRLAVLEARVRDDADQLAAVATGTFSIQAPRP